MTLWTNPNKSLIMTKKNKKITQFIRLVGHYTTSFFVSLRLGLCSIMWVVPWVGSMQQNLYLSFLSFLIQCSANLPAGFTNIITEENSIVIKFVHCNSIVIKLARHVIVYSLEVPRICRPSSWVVFSQICQVLL